MSAIELPAAAVLGPEDGKRLAMGHGSAIVFKVWGRRQPGDCDVAEVSLAPGNGPRPHVHAVYEHLWYVLVGEVEFLVGERSVRLGPGSAAFVPPGTMHGLRNAGAQQARLLLIVSPSGQDRYFEEIAALNAAGRLDASAMTELRLRYDTEEVDIAWGSAESLT